MLERQKSLKEEIETPKDMLLIWRRKIFLIIFISTLIAVILPYFINLKIAISSGQILNAFIYSLAYAIAIFITFARTLPFKVRAWTGLSMLYLVGAVSLITLGPLGGGRIWMFTFPVLITLLLGLRSGIIALALNATTIVAWIWAWSIGSFSWGVTLQFSLNQIFAIGGHNN